MLIKIILNELAFKNAKLKIENWKMKIKNENWLKDQTI